MESGETKTLKERLKALAAFLPVFDEPGFSFGVWVKPQQKPGVVTLPFFSFSEGAASFQKAVYDMGWINCEVSWVEWAATPRGRALLEDEVALSQATPEEISLLLTALVRKERFCEGTLESAFSSGLIRRILSRIAELATQIA